MKKLALLVLVVIALGACTGRMAILKHPETGDVQKCETSAASEFQTGPWRSSINHDNCIETWNKLGYKKIGGK